MKILPIALIALLPLLAFADQSPVPQEPLRDPIPDAAMLDRLERISLPIGKGAILQDRRGCLWSVMEGERAPRLVALTDEVNKPLCRTVEVDLAPESLRRGPAQE